jgi:hypothetical protein
MPHHHQAVQLDGRVGLDRVDKRQHGGRIDLLGRRRAPREVLAHDRSLRFGAHDVRHTHQGSLVAPQRCKHRDGHRLVERGRPASPLALSS